MEDRHRVEGTVDLVICTFLVGEVGVVTWLLGVVGEVGEVTVILVGAGAGVLLEMLDGTEDLVLSGKKNK